MSGFDLLPLLYLIPILLISLTIHEVAHGFIAYRLGDPTAKSMGRLSFNPLRHLDSYGLLMFLITYLAFHAPFFWAKPVPISPYYFRNRQRGMALVGAAGPASNFLIAVIFAVILRFAGVPLLNSSSSTLHVLNEIIFWFVYLNIVLGVFNLIPIPPLDGSRVLGGFLPRRAYEFWASIDRYGFFIIIILFFALRGGAGNYLFRVVQAVWHLIFAGSPYINYLD